MHIRFFCDPEADDETSTPTFLRLVDCEYRFIWHTSLVCPPESEPLTCVAYDFDVAEGESPVEYDLRYAPHTM